MESTLIPTYARIPLSFNYGKGVYLYTKNNDRYFDALSGIAVCCLGHAHPEFTDAITDQAKKLLHTSNLFEIPLQEKLSQKLCEISGMEKVFFGNSGAEANEAAIKLARLHGNKKNFQHPKIIVVGSSFHGRTLATLSATAGEKVRAGFEPLVEGFLRVDFNDITEIEKLAHEETEITAILVEPVQGEGGIRTADANYLKELRRICDENDWLLMLDEVQTGIARSGKWFAFQHSDIKPDVMSLAKGLANGLPIGASLVSGKATDLFYAGKHGTTFGGNPLVARGALAVLDIIEKENLVDNADHMGKYLIEGFTNKLSNNPMVKEIRNKGLLIGIELTKPCGELVHKALEQNIIINVTAESTIRLLPPLIITQEDADIIINKVCLIISNFS